jgi:SMC interacting uncharacterized protein involved in chromosome segregation
LSSLTKVFIVILVVLVLVASGIFISYIARTENYKVLYESEQTRAQIAEAGQANYMLAADNYRTLSNTEAGLRASDDASHRAEMARLEADKKKLELAIAGTTTNLGELQLKLASLETTIKGAQQVNADQAAKLDAARAEKDKALGQLNEQSAKLNSLIAENTILEKSVDALKEMLQSAQSEIKDLQKQGEATGTTKRAATAPQPAVKLDGSVTAVDRGLAQINLGSTSGVKKGMTFFVYRNADFVARLQIEEVQAGQAAGIVSDAKRDIRQGDKVTTSLE